MTKYYSQIVTVLLLSASAGTLFLFTYNILADAALPQFAYTAGGVIYLLAYVVCLFFLFATNQVSDFKFGWTVLLFFFGMFLYPLFWHLHLRGE